MGRKSTVDDLSPEEFDFVIRQLTDAGATDRELEAAFAREFDGKALTRSAIQRWRVKAGEELKDRFRLARFQAAEMVERLKSEGTVAEGADDYDVMVDDMTSRLLIATRDVVIKDPVRVLKIRQDEKGLRLKQRELELKEKDLQLRREKQEADAALRVDRLKVVAEFWQHLLGFFLKKAPGLADQLAKFGGELMEGFAKQMEG